MASPGEILQREAKGLVPLMSRHGFIFEFLGEWSSSGGQFASARFVKGIRYLELHYRGGLGIVNFVDGEIGASHSAYMAALGVLERCRYPGFSDDPRRQFENLLHDLQFAADFLRGDASVLHEAAAHERQALAEVERRLLFGYTGDERNAESMRQAFHAAEYSKVITLFEQIRDKGLLEPSDLKIVEIARKRSAKT